MGWAKTNGPDTLPASINGISDDNDIATVFANKYSNLYTSVPTDARILDEIRNDIQTELENNDYERVHVSLDDVNKSLSKLNSRKRDGTQGTYSDHFIFSSENSIVF